MQSGRDSRTFLEMTRTISCRCVEFKDENQTKENEHVNSPVLHSEDECDKLKPPLCAASQHPYGEKTET